MTLFEQVKECVTARQAAEHYGIKVKRNGMLMKCWSIRIKEEQSRQSEIV